MQKQWLSVLLSFLVLARRLFEAFSLHVQSFTVEMNCLSTRRSEVLYVNKATQGVSQKALLSCDKMLLYCQKIIMRWEGMIRPAFRITLTNNNLVRTLT